LTPTARTLDAGILTVILFAGGLAAGRLVSLIVDGRPAPLLLFFVALEFAVVLVGYWVFRLPEHDRANL